MATRRGKAVESFTDADMQPVVPGAADMSWQELLDAGAVHVQDIDDRLLLDKEKLVGQPMILTSWEFKEGSFGEYALVEIKTPTGSGIFVDGSTGVLEQLRRYDDIITRNNRWDDVKRAGIYVPAGLRASHYTYTDDAGREIPAITYYIDNKDG